MRSITRNGLWIVFALLCLVSAGTAQDASDDAAWKARIWDALQRIEGVIDTLDPPKTPLARPKQGQESELLPRVQAAHQRLAALEREASLPVGTIRGTSAPGDLTADLSSLATRARAIADARRPKPEEPATPKPPTSPAPPATSKEKIPPDPRKGWPTSLQFKATAKVVYRETGDWLYPEPRISRPGYDFLMNGYSGIVAFSLGSTGLKQEVASAEIRVVVSPRPPFSDDGKNSWVYDVTWSSEISQTGVFGNASLKHFPRHAQVHTQGPSQWIIRPKDVSLSLPALADVRSVRLKSGEEITFTVPETPPK